MFTSRTITVAINRPLDSVYAFACVPENLPKWASGLAINLRQEGRDWIGDTPRGPIKVRFSERNAFGVLDHWVTLPSGEEIYIPLRLIANGAGCEISLTLFRLSEMDELSFARDANTVRKIWARSKRCLNL